MDMQDSAKNKMELLIQGLLIIGCIPETVVVIAAGSTGRVRLTGRSPAAVLRNIS